MTANSLCFLNFSVIVRQIKKYHLEVAVDEIKVTFPYSAVLYLRGTKKTPGRMLVQIEVPGDSARYYVPIAKIVKYSIYKHKYCSK